MLTICIIVNLLCLNLHIWENENLGHQKHIIWSLHTVASTWSSLISNKGLFLVIFRPLLSSMLFGQTTWRLLHCLANMRLLLQVRNSSTDVPFMRQFGSRVVLGMTMVFSYIRPWTTSNIAFQMGTTELSGLLMFQYTSPRFLEILFIAWIGMERTVR